MASRMIQSYHEGCITERDDDDAAHFDRASLGEPATPKRRAASGAGSGRRAASCINPLQIFTWMHKKIVSSFSLAKTQDSSAGKSAQPKARTKLRESASPAIRTSCVRQDFVRGLAVGRPKVEPERRDSGIYSTLDRSRRSDVHYCLVQFAVENNNADECQDQDQDQDEIIEPAYEDCPASASFLFSELRLPSGKYHSQLSDTSNATTSTQRTSTTTNTINTTTSGYYSTPDVDTETDVATGANRTCDCVPKSVSAPVNSDWLAIRCRCSNASSIYSRVLPRSDHRPPPLPSQRLYRPAEIESLLRLDLANERENYDDRELTSSSIRCIGSLPRSTTFQNANNNAAAEELENIYESIDKLDALPASSSLYSLSRIRNGVCPSRSRSRSRLWNEKIDTLRFIDSPSESLMSLDTRTVRIHCLQNPLSRLTSSNSRRLLVQSNELRINDSLTML